MWSIQLYYNMDFWGILIECHKDLVKIVRWDLSNYHALKAGFNRWNPHVLLSGDKKGHHPNISAELVRILCHEVIGNWAEPLSDLMTTSRSSCTQLRLLICQHLSSPALWFASHCFGKILRLVDMVLSRATIEGGPENREAPGGGGISLLWKRNSWQWPMA